MEKKETPLDESNWRDAVIKDAVDFGLLINMGYRERIVAVSKSVPFPEQNMPEALQMYVDCLMGGMVSILVNEISAAKGFEDDCIEQIREKFKILREMKQNQDMQDAITKKKIQVVQ